VRTGRAIAAATAAVWLALAAAAWAQTPEEVVAAVRAATARYLDIDKARADGYVQITGMEERHGYHFLSVNAQILAGAAHLWSGELDLSRPPMLLYVQRDGMWQLAGVEYALPALPKESRFPGAQWHQHEASCHYRDYRELPGPAPSQCPARHPESGAEFVLWHPALAVVHVWAWYPNPLGPFAEQNPYLAPYGGLPHGAAGHGHARSGTEAAYSEFSHRSSGVFLLFIAGVIFWESRRPRPFPWSALSSPLWLLFGLYLFVRSDPEAWPWGPKGFLEIFPDPEVLQHKILILMPVAIGLVEGLRKAGCLRHPGWGYLFPALAVIGGSFLLLHFHEGLFHVDAIYLQHAGMGLAVLGIGMTLLVARRARWAWPLLHHIWPFCLLLLALILILYSET
jgi:putative copper resistance protein D